MIDLRLGDCLEVMRGMEANTIDTCITDPPYELGFMGKKWDSTGIAFQVETWREVYRVLKPGAILLAFGGTRTYHRMVCAIEDAGFEIRDMIEWVYGSGFPKSYDIGKGIDKKAGATGEVIGKEMVDVGMQSGNMHAGRKSVIIERDITAPATPEAQLWHGWGTSLKPAHEPIVLAMKPVDGTYVNNALTWGVAGLWIDGGRVQTDEVTGRPMYESKGWKNTSGMTGSINDDWKKGRFPANLIHDGSDEVLECFPMTKSGLLAQGHKRGETSVNYTTGGGIVYRDYGNDSGSAARFFYCAKASRSERNAGLEGMVERSKATTYGNGFNSETKLATKAQQEAGFVDRGKTTNHHPTVKPIELMRYLVRLTKTPTGGVVLDPFMGSGTTGIACLLEGREFIGIEREPDYMEIARRRIEHWAQQQPMLI